MLRTKIKTINKTVQICVRRNIVHLLTTPS